MDLLSDQSGIVSDTSGRVLVMESRITMDGCATKWYSWAKYNLYVIERLRSFTTIIQIEDACLSSNYVDR